MRVLPAPVGVLARRAALVGAALLLPACLSGQGVYADRDAVFSVGGVRFPSVIDTFMVINITRYPVRELGVLLDYRSPVDEDARIDLYVYPAGSAEPGADRAEFDQSLASVVRYAELSRGQVLVNVEVQDSMTVFAPGGLRFGGRWAMASMREGTKLMKSELYLFRQGNVYYKYRITYTSSLEANVRPHIGALLTESLQRVRADPS